MKTFDVSKCVHFYQNDKCKNTCHWFCTPCEWVDTKECTYKQLQQYKQLCEQKTVDNFDLMSQIDKLKADKKKCKQQLQQLKQENEELKKKHIIKNGHCEFFEGQTGLCRAKEYKRCNPINCKVFTLDSVSTILSLQAENEELKQEIIDLKDYWENKE